MDSINRKLIATSALLTAIAFAAIMGGIFATQASTTSSDTTTGTISQNGDYILACNNSQMLPDFGGEMRHGHRRGGGLGQVQVSEEYEQTVIGIANNDTDVQNLLAEGYNVTSVRPIISATIDASGYITSRATSAVLTLQKDTSGSASVLVDVTEGKVTKIVILTRTVIDKT